jgi:NAD(P)H-flavin reductase
MPVTSEPIVSRLYRVEHSRIETKDTFTLALESREASDGPVIFQPGQFNMLYAFGTGEVPISISGDPAKPQRLAHTIREVGLVTRALHRLKPGQTLSVRGPYGNSWPVMEGKGRDIVIVAGGIGLAPLRPALYHLLTHRQDYGQVVLLYGARLPEEMLYRDELQEWGKRKDLEVHITVDRATGSWRGNVGVVPGLISRAHFNGDQALALVCGPEIMMRFTVPELEKRGIRHDRIYLSMERNMKCGVGLCGHCQFGPQFICKDGPVFPFDRIRSIFEKRDI